MADPRPSIVLDRGMKWIGPMWSQVDENLVFRFTPSKTENTTGKEVAVDFTLCPMIMEELALTPPEQRKGPLVVNPMTGKPYRPDYFQKLWRDVRDAQGVSQAIWNRDLRAGGITEGRAANASTDDLAKLAGHADKRTTAKVYDRAQIEAARRVAVARAVHRSRKK
jgi:integrase